MINNYIQHTKYHNCISGSHQCHILIHPLKDGGDGNKSADYYSSNTGDKK